MFRKILIANRGEIACRVINTARKLGVATVAVHSNIDAGARHVTLADEAVSLGGATPAESYLRGDAIIAAALVTNAEAIHPGYGFLSENPVFVDAVEAAGLVFIGPSADAIRAMGLKDAAKALMEKAGVPVVPGYHGADQDDMLLAKKADEIGYPVLIKAVAGGGGKGMRLVEAPDAFAAALVSARSEAQTAFGNPDVLVEKFVTSPRHIEIQVFGDGTEAVHLFERDCSLQRRHQKVIEEAPAPGMTLEMREVMGAAAVRAAKTIGYKGAGTVEFIVDGSDGLRTEAFWFMEMNTRLQVEHPVTEAITGVDLVEWQLRVAAGEPLPRTQSELSISGHAFEARLYAEDAPAGFLPATGTLTHLRFTDGARADTGVRAGDTISPYYDPMIAKVIVHGATREIALGQMRLALANTEVAGTVTNLGFLGALCDHPGFASGNVDTGLIGRDLDALMAVPDIPAWVAAQAILEAADIAEADKLAGFTLWSPLVQRIVLERGGEEIVGLLCMQSAETCEIEVAGRLVQAARKDGEWRFNGQTGANVVRSDNKITVFAQYGIAFDVVDLLARDVASGIGGNVVEAPMPGLLKAVLVARGDEVAKGAALAVLEAMKMEHTLAAARDGVVAEVFCETGAQVEAGAALVRLEEEEA
jgi:3-methylcrotonyl-CoA carboxylase alpha subunit